MKLAQDYKNIASLYTGGKHIQENFAKIDAYLSLFCEKKPVLFLKQVHGNRYIYEWKSNSMFLNGFSPCLIIEAIADKNMGRSINLQNKNILQTNVYGNFILTENNILNKKTGIEHLGSF